MNYKNLIKDFNLCNINEINWISESEENTLQFAEEFAKYLSLGNIVTLSGELGSGKTVFMKGISSYFNLEQEVSSPTFTIVNEYINDKITLYHFDVYRLENSKQFEDTIGTDYFYNGLCIIEWGEIIEDILPKNTIKITISKLDANKRNINIRRK